MSNLEKDLAEVMNNLDDPDNWKVQRDFIRTHHAEIAQLAKDSRRLRALERAISEMSRPWLRVQPHFIEELNERADEIMRNGTPEKVE